jgi:predicted glycogen debranching enzyme
MATAFNQETCHNLDKSLHVEWLETNGLGGYASGTIAACHTRKYHGLLVASLPNPPGRYLLLSNFEDSLLIGDQESPLACHQYPGAIHPAGHLYLTAFSLDDCPTFTYQVGKTVITKEIIMPKGENTILVRYEILEAPQPVTLRLRPLLAYRDHHGLKRQDSCIQANATIFSNGFDIHPYDGMPNLHVRASQVSSFMAQPDWYRNFKYSREAERGYDHHEDLFCPGFLDIELRQGISVIVSASCSSSTAYTETAWNSEIALRRQAYQNHQNLSLGGPADLAAPLSGLIRAGQQFLIWTPDNRPSIIAGYPWFDDWGRDTLIALPGLTFYSGNPDMGVAILKAVGNTERDGIIPNFFSSNPDHHAYNAVDASLWYFRAIQHMLATTRDYDTVRQYFWPVMLRIITRFMAGTRNDIYMNSDGLLHAGNRNTQLTWMDAKSRGIPVTPRHGYAVDINALWYNALRLTNELAIRFETQIPWPANLANRCSDAFRNLFWRSDDNGLADSFADGHLDTSIRPNQILAVSLPYSPLSSTQQAVVVETVRRELLTPYGLRTLSPYDPAYCGRYEGDQNSRDAAYHQGTVWPWLIGNFGEATLRVATDKPAAASNLLQILRPLIDYSLSGNGLFQVPEIFDGASPQRPNGCFAQAWSVAELIRLFALCRATRLV